jgi:hypothetical protein
MFKKYTILTLTLLAGQQASSMTYLRRFSPAVITATAAYASYFAKPVKCDGGLTKEQEEFITRTPEHHLAILDNTDMYDSPKAIRLLKKVGVNFENAKWMGTPLLWKESLDPETFAAAIEAGARFDAEHRPNKEGYVSSSQSGETPLNKQLAYFTYAVVNDDDTAKSNALKKIEILLSKGAKPKMPDWGDSPLFRPLSVGPVYDSILHDSIEDSINIKLFRKLLAAGGNPKETNKAGQNVLHNLATSWYLTRHSVSETEKAEVVATLLSKGANPWSKNLCGNSPISLAKRCMDNSKNEADRTVYGNFITTAARHQKCSWKRPLEKNITNLNREQTIKEATQGWFRTCTDEGK